MVAMSDFAMDLAVQGKLRLVAKQGQSWLSYCCYGYKSAIWCMCQLVAAMTLQHIRRSFSLCCSSHTASLLGRSRAMLSLYRGNL